MRKIQIHLIILSCFFTLLFLATYKINPLNGIVNYDDQDYIFNKSFSSWNQNINNGESRTWIMYGFFPKFIFPKVLQILSFNDNWISYILWIFPMIICFIIYYFIINDLTKNELLSFFSGLVVIFNNLTIQYMLFLPSLYFYAISVFGIHIFMTYKIYKCGSITLKHILIITLSSFFLFHPFYLLIDLIYISFFFIFFILNKRESISFKKDIFKVFLIFILIFLINSYWLIPFISFLTRIDSTQLYTPTNLDAVFEGWRAQVNPLNTFIGWDQSPKPSIIKLFNYITQNPINVIFPVLLWIIAIFIGLIKKNKLSKFFIFLIFSSILFFSLATGPKNPLMSYIWMYLWNNIGSFHFFRSFGKFSIIIYPIFILIISIFYINVTEKLNKSDKKLLKIFVLILIIVLIISQINVFTGNYGKILNAYRIPDSYQDLNILLKEEPGIFLIVTYPTIGYESYIWTVDLKEQLTGRPHYLSEYYIEKNIVYEKFASNLREKNVFYKNLFPKQNEPLGNITSNLNKTNIKYILVHKDMINILEEGNKTINTLEYNSFFSNHNFTLVRSNEEFNLYLNGEYLPLILGNKNTYFKYYQDVKYRIYKTNVSENISLYFLANFDPNWKLYLVKHPGNDWCNPIEFYNNTNTTECEHTQKFFEGEELSYLYKKPIFDDSHQIVYDYANSWTIDPQYIKDHYSKDYYTENPDGSINVEFVMYFKPQSYFYIGLIISGTTLICCIIYLIYDWRKERKHRKFNNPQNIHKIHNGT